MRIGLSALFLALLSAPAAMSQYQMSPAGAPPDSLPPALSAALEAKGARIEAGGKVWCEVWAVKSLATGPKSTAESVSLPAISHGALLGVVRFPAQALDRRGNSIPAGVYAMRYSVYPADGNHMGAAPQRDFAILIPAARDKAPETMLPYEALMKFSTEATGMPHPSCLSLAPSSQGTLPSLHKEERDWVLHLKIGELPVALIVVGRAEG